MGKFFKKKPAICNICGEEKIIFKTMRSGVTKLNYCKDCYNEYYTKIQDRVKAQVRAAVKKGQKLDIKDALDLTKKITKEVEEENQ